MDSGNEWNRFQIKTVFGNDDDFHLKKKTCFHFRRPNGNFTGIFLTWFWLLNLIRGAMWRCINNYYKGEIHWLSLRFYVNTQSKYPWHLRNYNDLLRFAFNTNAPWCLRNYIDHLWASGLIHKTPLGWLVYLRGVLCINPKSQGWLVYFRRNMLQISNLKGGYCNFLNIKGALCIKVKLQGKSLYFTLIII